MGRTIFGEYVKTRREALGLGLRQLARALHVGPEARPISPTFISRIENGYETKISEEVVVAWAELLGEDPDYLLALAGKLRQEIVQIIIRNPAVYIDLIRKLETLSEDKQAKLIQMVKDGNW